MRVAGKTTFRQSTCLLLAFTVVAIACPVNGATQATRSPAPVQQSAPKIPPDQLDSLVAPIALYPDPLLAQVLAASTYPLEIVQLQQWLSRNPNVKGKELEEAVAKQPWDPSVQSMAALPDVVKRLADDIQWTTDLGNAFLAQQSDVMDAVQRMRQKAQGNGNLKSTEQQKVETKVVENKSVIVVEQANPQVVYVPSYNPVVVYGPPVYPYPPIYYPPPGYYAAGMAISFGVGVAVGAAWGGAWGWNCGWGGHNNIYINNNNTFIHNDNYIHNLKGQSSPTGTGNWQHNPQHRGGTPYPSQNVANRYGGTTRGDSLANRQASARQQISREGGNLPSTRGGAGVSNRPAGGAAGNRAGAGDRASATGSRAGGSNRAANTGGDRVGNRSVQTRPAGGDRSAFGGGGGGFNGSSARASSSRGSSSMRSFGGGGRAGGGRRR